MNYRHEKAGYSEGFLTNQPSKSRTETTEFPNSREISPADMVAFEEYRAKMISDALDALRTDAESYRDFRVACTMLVIDKHGNYSIFASGNNKQYQGQPKLCAERSSLQHARDEALQSGDQEQRVVAIVVLFHQT
jgi:cytidine deaminase